MVSGTGLFLHFVCYGTPITLNAGGSNTMPRERVELTTDCGTSHDGRPDIAQRTLKIFHSCYITDVIENNMQLSISIYVKPTRRVLRAKGMLYSGLQ